MTARVKFIEDTAPGTPPAGYIYVYAKTDGLMYYKGDDGVERALQGAAGATGATGLSASQAQLISMVHVDTRTTRRDLVRIGFMPAFFNQQWGGAPMPFELVNSVDSAIHEFDAMSGYLDTHQATSITNVTGATWTAQGFKVGKAVTLTAVWVKLYKSGNPANNLELRILSDDGTGTKPTGSTPITNGTATAQSGKIHSAENFGQWVRFVFPTPPSLTGGTQYHIALKSSGAVDASNFWLWASNAAGKYPYGNQAFGDGTPTWTANTAIDCAFLIEGAASDNVLQSGGTFSDGKLVFFEGSPINQSGGYCRSIKDIDGFDIRKGFTLLLRGTAFTKDKTIWEMHYGMDHDRIVLRCNVTTGFAQVDVYEKDGTRHTVTATSLDLASGDHDVAIYVRAANDGADRIDLYVDGTANGTPITGASIEIDPLFQRLGTEWLGGGFAIAPTWTQKLAMGVLPSADSPAWTFTQSAGTEAAKMSVSGSRLYQNKNGYAATETGYYQRTVTLSNTNGWTVVDKSRVLAELSIKDSSASCVRVRDGTKDINWFRKEYYDNFYGSAGIAYPQSDNKQFENTFIFSGKGSDFLGFKNGRLVMDGTGLLTNASGVNEIDFGDTNPTSNENADVIWDYVAYYSTAWLTPQFTGGSLSEYALWSGDYKAALAGLYNSGTEISVKVYSGIRKNYTGDNLTQVYVVHGVTVAPATTVSASAMVAVTDMEVFCIGSQIDVSAASNGRNSAAGGQVAMAFFTDGQMLMDGPTAPNDGFVLSQSDSAGHVVMITSTSTATVPFGLHKQEIRFHGDGATTTYLNRTRRMVVKVKA